MLDRAVALGFDAVCTGHHARLQDGRLRRSVDEGKDQSYVLAVLTREQLDRSMFPLGASTKAEVRAEAAARGMAVASKPDSHDVCFIPDGDTRAFLAGRLGDAPGHIVTQDGALVGQHDGAYGFTIGQRKGLRVGVPAGDGQPRYVLDIEPVSRTVTVGPRQALDVREIVAERPVWTGCPPLAGPRDCLVQLRAHGEVHPATAELDGDAAPDPAAHGCPRRGPWPGRGALRRRHRARQRDHRRHQLSRGTGGGRLPQPAKDRNSGY